jgi:hypothetical protein
LVEGNLARAKLFEVLRGLSHAHNRDETVSHSCYSLACNDVIRFVVISTTLRVADNHIPAVQGLKEHTGHVTCVGAIVMNGEILTPKGEWQVISADESLD